MAALAVALALPGAAGAAPGPDGGAWAPDGTPVAGTADVPGAPLLTAGSTYRDTLAKGATVHYTVRLGAVDDSGPATTYLSAFAIPRPGSRVGFLDGISLRLETGDGTLCDSYDARFAGDDATAPVGGVVRRPGAADGVCRAAGTYVLAVARESAAGSGDDVWPLDLRFMSEPGTDPSEADAHPVPTYAPAAPATVAGIPQRVHGSAGMDGDGTRLPGSGVYRDELLPGQTRYYRVPLAWGQRLSAAAEFGDATMTRANGFTASGLRISLFSPARGFVDGQTFSYTGDHASLGAQTPAVDYQNRLSSDSRVNSAATAGWYYVQVSLHPAVAQYAKGAVPVTLRMAVTGSAKPAPDYRGSALRAGFGLSAGSITHGLTAPAASADPTPDPGAGTRNVGASGTASGTPVRRTLGYGAMGLAAVFFAWPTMWLLRGRRGGAGR